MFTSKSEILHSNVVYSVYRVYSSLSPPFQDHCLLPDVWRTDKRQNEKHNESLLTYLWGPQSPARDKGEQEIDVLLKHIVKVLESHKFHATLVLLSFPLHLNNPKKSFF